MKHNATLLLLIATIFLHTNAQAYSQGITLKVSDVTLDKVFSLLQKQTKFVFVYSAKQLAGTKHVSVDVTNEKFEKVMQMVMDGQPLRYEVDKEYVIIKIKMPSVVEVGEGKPGELSGVIVNEKGDPIAGATVSVLGSNIVTATGADGTFVLKNVTGKITLWITSIGYESQRVNISNNSRQLSIRLTVTSLQMKEVVVMTDGYNKIPKERATGAFNVIDSTLLNRRISTNVLDRIENLTPGVLFDRTSGAPDPLLIRGRNSIFSNVAPLIVLDNFPYDGDISGINPNDIESITILKDAAAASIWGARAGNGVIILTTKRGKTSKPTVSLNINTTIQQKPNLNSMSIISSEEYIELEKYLFKEGYYDLDIAAVRNPPPLTPVVDILAKNRNGDIPDEEAARQIDEFKKVDARSDLREYFYQAALNQQNALNVSGNTNVVNYYMSVGWDKNKQSLVGNFMNRVTIRNQNTFKVNDRLNIDLGLNYIKSNSTGNGNPGVLGFNLGGTKKLYPYADLVNKNGEALPIVRNLRSSYIDTVGGDKLLNWMYYPYDDMNNTTTVAKTSDIVVNAGLRIFIAKYLSAEIRYQYENSTSNITTNNSIESFYTRDLINRFYQPTGTIRYPVPIGDILFVGNTELTSHQGRAQLNFNRKIKAKHDINAFAGWEIKNVLTKGDNYRLYGYKKEGNLINSSMDFITRFPQYTNPTSRQRVPNVQAVWENLDRFVSYYTNASYSYDEKYIVSMSVRKDAANLFGAKTNQKGVPLWSIGGAWNLSNELFYDLKILPYIKLRSSYGQSGNFSRLASAFTTIVPGINSVGLPSATIQTPANENLRWEQNRQLNLGIDFQFVNKIITGSIDYYWRYNKDLMAEAPIDPTLGINPVTNTYFGNVASSKGNGFELNLTSLNLNRKVKWSSNFLITYQNTNVSSYALPKPTSSNIYTSGGINPIIGKPLFALFSYRWGRLDGLTGDPQGYLGKNLSKDYSAILNTTLPDSLVYHGNIQPPLFGALRNTIQWNNWILSFNISYKFGYYFRLNSIQYASLLYAWTGHSDYSKRWQFPGDEKLTNVPSLQYPVNGDREAFYSKSEVLVQKGDHIRFEDVNITYSINQSKWKKLPFKQINIYGYLGNLNLLIWKTNKSNIDPNFNGGAITGKTLALGLNVIL